MFTELIWDDGMMDNYLHLTAFSKFFITLIFKLSNYIF